MSIPLLFALPYDLRLEALPLEKDSLTLVSSLNTKTDDYSHCRQDIFIRTGKKERTTVSVDDTKGPAICSPCPQTR